MKTLEEIKDDYVRDKFLSSQELDTWVAFQNYFASRHPEWFEQHWEEISQRYATEYAKEALKNASENADTIEVDNGYGLIDVVDKKSILSEDNSPKH